ncbi:MAG TPA: DUF2505 family protein [Kofleriaceae bacterium]|nr:DUF2505 family protein [Kofleriaceae bacterium]
MTPLHIEHEFRAPSVARFWDSYFDPAHRARLDAATGIASRELLERTDDGATLLVVQRIVPSREVPGWLRKLTGAGLDYVERQLLTRADDRIDIDIQPAMFPSRTHMKLIYAVRPAEPGKIVRTCDGEIEMRVPVFGGRIERHIREDLEHSYGVAVPLTQEWLDAHPL